MPRLFGGPRLAECYDFSQTEPLEHSGSIREEIQGFCQAGAAERRRHVRGWNFRQTSGSVPESHCFPEMV